MADKEKEEAGEPIITPMKKHGGLAALGPNVDPQLLPHVALSGEVKPSKETKEKSSATKYYIASYYDNLLRSIEDRTKRRQELADALQNTKLSHDEKDQLLEVYQEKESEYMRLKRKPLSIHLFETVKVIGRGSFGEVRLVRHKETREIFALKKMKKEHMIKQKQIANVRAERDLMSESGYNDWLVALYYAFQDQEYLYLVMEYYPGGDLWNLLQSVQLTEHEVRFYLAEIVMAVASIHAMGYFHRDLKPENVLFDRGGHVKLADFGLCKPVNTAQITLLNELAKKSKEELEQLVQDTEKKTRPMSSKFKAQTWKKKRREMAFSVVGTPGYAAPEVMHEVGYGAECDWWSLGIMMYEMVYGYHPFHADSIEDLCVNVLQWKKTLKFPKDVEVSPEAVDLMQGLINDSKVRLGRGGVKDIQNHPFFKDVVWPELREIEPPFIPDVKGIADASYFEDFQEEQAEDEGKDVGPRYKMGQKNLPFVGFTYKRFEAVMDRRSRIDPDADDDAS